MLDRRELLRATGALAAVSTLAPGCALIFNGPTPSGMRCGVRWGFVILDLLVGGFVTISSPVLVLVIPVGLLVDLATGAIYKDRRDKPCKRGRPRDADDWDLDPDEDARNVLPTCEESRRIVLALGDRPALPRTLAAHVERCPTCRLALTPDAATLAAHAPARSLAELRVVAVRPHADSVEPACVESATRPA